MTWLVATALLIAVLLVLLLVAQRRDARRLQVTNLRLLVPDLPKALQGRRIVFLSDLHVDRLYVSREHLLEAVREARPDLLLLGGDYTYGLDDHQAAFDLVERLSGHCPTFAVRGNTDIWQTFDSQRLGSIVRASGGDLLINEAGRISFESSVLEIMGLDDTLEGSSNPARMLAQSVSEAHLRIVLAHSPAQWQELATLGAHICLCGHTHGGQIRLPRFEAPVTHSSYPRRLAAGLFHLVGGPEPEAERVVDHWQVLSADGAPIDARSGEHGLLYVSRGVGVAWVPLRLFCPPEMVLIELARDEVDGSVSKSD